MKSNTGHNPPANMNTMLGYWPVLLFILVVYPLTFPFSYTFMSDPLPIITTYMSKVVAMVVEVVVVFVFINLGLGWDIYDRDPMEMMVSAHGNQKRGRRPYLHTESYRIWHRILKNCPPSPLYMCTCNSFRHPLHPKIFTSYFPYRGYQIWISAT